ncbi:DUF2281 domain-containing protein [Spirulina major]|uniref:DUF2281 domain-containing protein n=1 Tax=Spirulina major TaxID=270636 RepID=UPI000933C45D|nr:DUF2281 domain-containing protein [Spirulina major]
MTPRTQILQELDNLPDDLQQQVLQFIQALRQQQVNSPQTGNAWDTLATLTGTIEAPSDWSIQHDHYLYDTPKQAQ